MRYLTFPILAAVSLVLTTGSISAADGPPFKQGPAKVVARTAEWGVLEPQGEFRGSVYFKEVSEVATEVQGKVSAVFIEDGQHVHKGDLLVQLDDELLKKDLAALTAQLDRDRTELQDAEVRLGRAENLVERGLSPSEQLDTTRFDVQSLRYAVAATAARLDRMDTLIAKTGIHAPFDGLVLDRATNLGEWKSDGDTVAVVAREGVYEIVIDIPETSLPYVEPGRVVELQVGDESISGTVAAIVPRGDILTRTFPVKIYIETTALLMEGMAAHARFPIGPREECLIVPRDAVLNRSGATMVYTVQDSVARRTFVDVIGYRGMNVGIRADDLGPGQLFIVNGHERLEDGDRVEVIQDDPDSDASVAGTDD